MKDTIRFAGSLLLFFLASICYLGSAQIPALISGALGFYFLPPFRRSIGFAPSRTLSIVVSLIGFSALAWSISSIGAAVMENEGDAAAADSATVEPDGSP